MELEKLILSRWENSSRGYSDIVSSELLTEEKDGWIKFLMEKLPPDKDIKILDIGCGPGFFATLLGSLGYRDIIGIDISPKMIKEAKKRVKDLDFNCDFKVMDCHNLEFLDSSFDVIISRNVVWTLYNPEKAYEEWNRCLKNGGMILVFDANWMFPNFDSELKMQKQKDDYEYQKLYGKQDESCVQKELTDYLDRKAVLAKVLRPEWDKKILTELGMKVETDENVYKRLWGAKRKLRYRTTPLFSVIGYK